MDNGAFGVLGLLVLKLVATGELQEIGNVITRHHQMVDHSVKVQLGRISIAWWNFVQVRRICNRNIDIFLFIFMKKYK